MSLLSEAKKVPIKKKQKREFSKEEQELAVGYANGEVSMAQVAVVLKKETSSVVGFLFGALKQYVRNL